MTHRTIDQVPAGVPEMEQILEAVLLQALEIAKEKLDAKELLVPFTALAVGETLFTETHPSEDPDECFKMAQHTVQNARGALAYAFCYDGYVDTDEGELDAIIAEGGVPGASTGHAVGFLYKVEGEGETLEFKIEDAPVYIGQAPNFMEYTLVLDGEEFDEGEVAEDAEELEDEARMGDEAENEDSDEYDEQDERGDEDESDESEDDKDDKDDD